MPTRAEMDKPAIVMTSIAGLVLAAASIPFLPALYCESPAATCKTAPAGETLMFDVTWFKAAAGSVPLTAGDGPQQVNATLQADDILTAGIHVAATACDDQYNVGADLGQQPVTVTWTVNRRVAGDVTALDTNTFTCADGLDVDVPRYAAPDVATLEAPDEASAVVALWQHPNVAGQNETADYELVVRWSRPAGGIPPPPVGPIGQTSFALTMEISIEAWDATVTVQPPPEVVR